MSMQECKYSITLLTFIKKLTTRLENVQCL